MVANAAAGELRARYERAVRELRRRAADMRGGGASPEAVARALHAERRELAARFKHQTPEPYRSGIYRRTFEVYGDELGPSIEFLRAQGKSWDAIIDSATRPGPGPDRFLSGMSHPGAGSRRGL